MPIVGLLEVSCFLTITGYFVSFLTITTGVWGTMGTGSTQLRGSWHIYWAIPILSTLSFFIAISLHLEHAYSWIPKTVPVYFSEHFSHRWLSGRYFSKGLQIWINLKLKNDVVLFIIDVLVWLTLNNRILLCDRELNVWLVIFVSKIDMVDYSLVEGWISIDLRDLKPARVSLEV